MVIKKDGTPYIIAEMSGNHNQDLDRALQLVQAAADAGADAIKLQTYRADTITLDVDNEHFTINDKNSLWDKRKLYDLYEEAHTPWEWHKPIMDKARECGIDCFSSPFDFEAVEFLETLGVGAYKIASFEITHTPLIEACAKTGKPLIISTGNASEADIELAVETAKKAGAKEIVLLKCTSQYPADASDANLQTMLDIKEKYNVEVGLSDHTLGVGVACVAASLGAVVIEKHFTLARADGGVDSAFSLEPLELKMLVDDCKRASVSLGKVHYSGTDSEQVNKKFRQQLWVAEDVAEGDILTADNVKIRRPNIGGFQPSEYENVLGKKFNKPAKKGTSLEGDMIN